MRPFLRATFLPTAALVALCLFDRWVPGSGLLMRDGPMLIALAIVPLAWFFYVTPPGKRLLARAALAGAASALLIRLIPHEILAVPQIGKPSSGDVGVAGFGDLFIIGFALLVHAPIGAVTGVALTWLQQRWLPDPPGARTPFPAKRNRVLTSAMIALLGAPLVAFLASHVLSRLVWRFFPSAVGLSPYFVPTLLVLVPIAAFMGSRSAEGAARGDPATRAFRESSAAVPASIRPAFQTLTGAARVRWIEGDGAIEVRCSRRASDPCSDASVRFLEAIVRELPHARLVLGEDESVALEALGCRLLSTDRWKEQSPLDRPRSFTGYTWELPPGVDVRRLREKILGPGHYSILAGDRLATAASLPRNSSSRRCWFDELASTTGVTFFLGAAADDEEWRVWFRLQS